MKVQFTPDQQAFVSDALASGRLQRPEEAMQQALLLWEERERKRSADSRRVRGDEDRKPSINRNPAVEPGHLKNSRRFSELRSTSSCFIERK